MSEKFCYFKNDERVTLGDSSEIGVDTCPFRKRSLVALSTWICGKESNEACRPASVSQEALVLVAA